MSLYSLPTCWVCHETRKRPIITHIVLENGAWFWLMPVTWYIMEPLLGPHQPRYISRVYCIAQTTDISLCVWVTLWQLVTVTVAKIFYYIYATYDEGFCVWWKQCQFCNKNVVDSEQLSLHWSMFSLQLVFKQLVFMHFLKETTSLLLTICLVLAQCNASQDQLPAW